MGFRATFVVWLVYLSTITVSSTTEQAERPNIILIVADDLMDKKTVGTVLIARISNLNCSYSVFNSLTSSNISLFRGVEASEVPCIRSPIKWTTRFQEGQLVQGWNDVSFHGSDQIPTPNIDKLATEGIILNNYYVSPICTPTRSAIMTGRHPIHTGLQVGVLYSAVPYGLPLTERIMPQWLQALGYRTHIVGKWHLGMYAKEYTPTRRGFETHYGFIQGAEGYFDHTYEGNVNYWGLDWRRNDDVIRNETDMYSTDLLTKEAVKLIQQHNTSQPMYLYFAHQAVHRGNYPDPLEAPQSYVDRFLHIQNYKRRLYAGMVAALDDSVGAVIQTLEARGMLQNSVIIFTTDNGGPANGNDYNAANNFPLRGVKATYWEGGVRGTGFIYSSLFKKTNYVSNHMMHVCDWLPTLYRAAGGDPGIMPNLDGYDFWDVLSTNGTSPRNEMLHNIDPIVQNAALRMGDYKLVLGDLVANWSGWYPPWTKPDEDLDTVQADDKNLKYVAHYPDRNLDTGDDFPGKSKSRGNKNYEYALPKGDTKSPLKRRVEVHCGTKPENASTNCDPISSPCLFNIAKDPCEYNNIAAQHQDIVIRMLVRLNKYSNTMVPPLNVIPEDPAGNPKLFNDTWMPWVTL